MKDGRKRLQEREAEGDFPRAKPPRRKEKKKEKKKERRTSFSLFFFASALLCALAAWREISQFKCSNFVCLDLE
jgi:hypothetical protein